MSFSRTLSLCLVALAIAISVTHWHKAAAHGPEAPAAVSTPISGGPDLTIQKSGPPPLWTPVVPGSALTFQIHVQNLGDAPASPVEVLDPDVGFYPAAVNATQGSCSLTVVDYSLRMFCDLGTLAPPGGPEASSATITLSGQAPGTGRAPGLGVIRTNTATVDPSNKIAESNESNNAASVSYFNVEPTATPTPTYTPIPPLPGGPELTVEKGGPPPLYTPVAPGSSLTFWVEVHNLGDAAAGPVEVLDPHVGGDASVYFVSQGSCELTPDDLGSSHLFCDLGAIPAAGGQDSSSAVVIISETAPPTGRAPGLGVIMTNTVTVDPENKVVESNEDDNTASVSYFLIEPGPTATPTCMPIPPTPTPLPGSGAVGGIAEPPDERGSATGSGATVAVLALGLAALALATGSTAATVAVRRRARR